MIDIDDFNWRLEEACLNAWPSRQSVLSDGWLLRRSGGAVRRSNSVNPLRGGRGPAESVIALAERVYAEFGQEAIFRVPDIADELASPLAARGYVVHAPTLTLVADLAGNPPEEPDGTVILSASPSRRWLEARARLAGVGAADRRIYSEMTELLALPVRYAGIDHHGEIVAQAYGVLHRGLLVLNSVATDPDHRRRGLGRAVLGALMAWARRNGATEGVLQVLAENEPALSLYRSLGFLRTAYTYHYRIRG